MKMHAKPTRLRTTFALLAALAWPLMSHADGPTTKPAIEKEALKLNVIIFDSVTDLEAKTATYKVNLNGEFTSGSDGLPIRAAFVDPVSVMADGKNMLLEVQHPGEEEIQRMVSNAGQWGGMWKPKAPAALTFTAENSLPMVIGPIKLRSVILKPEKIETVAIEPFAAGEAVKLVPGMEIQLTSVTPAGGPQQHAKYTLRMATPAAWNALPAWPTQLCSVAADGNDGQKLSAAVATDIKRKKAAEGYEYMGAISISAHKEPKPPATLKAEKAENANEAAPVEIPPIQVARVKLEVGTGIKPHVLDIGLEKLDLSTIPLLFPPPAAGDQKRTISGANEAGWRIELAKMSFRSASGLPALVPYRYGAELRLIAPKPEDHFKIVWGNVGYVVAATTMHDARVAAAQEFPPRKETDYWSLDKAHWGSEARLVGNFQTYPGEPALVESVEVRATVIRPTAPTTKTIDLVAGKIPIDAGGGVMMTLDEPIADEANKTVRIRLKSMLATEMVQGKPRPHWLGKQVTAVIPLDASGKELPTKYTPREHGMMADLEGDAERFQLVTSLTLPAVGGQTAKPVKLKIETAASVTWEDVTIILRGVDLAVPGLLPSR